MTSRFGLSSFLAVVVCLNCVINVNGWLSRSMTPCLGNLKYANQYIREPFTQWHAAKKTSTSSSIGSTASSITNEATLNDNSDQNEGENEEQATTISSMKDSLMRAALLGGQGVYSREDERKTSTSLIEQLEQQQQQRGTPSTALLDGTWELVLSNVEPFRASVFFLALADAVEENLIPNASDGALTVHSLATGGGEVGRVAHVIEDNGTRLHSLVELKSGSLPSLPLALTGTVISSGELSSSSIDHETLFSLSLKNTTVQDNKVRYGLPSDDGLKPGTTEPNLMSWIGDQLVPSGDIFSSVLDPLYNNDNNNPKGSSGKCSLKLSYVDNDMLVWRTSTDNYFVFLRGEEKSWPAMDELRSRKHQNEKTPSSPIGSAFSLGMLNPFFSRSVAELRRNRMDE